MGVGRPRGAAVARGCPSWSRRMRTCGNPLSVLLAFRLGVRRRTVGEESVFKRCSLALGSLPMPDTAFTQRLPVVANLGSPQGTFVYAGGFAGRATSYLTLVTAE